jgi:hypothetical protein
MRKEGGISTGEKKGGESRLFLQRPVRFKAKELLHQRHLSGEFDPSLKEAMEETSKIMCAELVKTVKKIQEEKNGNGKNGNERVSEKQHMRLRGSHKYRQCRKKHGGKVI